MNQRSKQTSLAPGMRVVIRDAEWIIRKVDMASDGGQQLTCNGVSELVRDKMAIFLTNLEGDIRVMDPAKVLLSFGMPLLLRLTASCMQRASFSGNSLLTIRSSFH